jgi:hypothetical protein
LARLHGRSDRFDDLEADSTDNTTIYEGSDHTLTTVGAALHRTVIRHGSHGGTHGSRSESARSNSESNIMIDSESEAASPATLRLTMELSTQMRRTRSHRQREPRDSESAGGLSRPHDDNTSQGPSKPDSRGATFPCIPAHIQCVVLHEFNHELLCIT